MFDWISFVFSLDFQHVVDHYQLSSVQEPVDIDKEDPMNRESSDGERYLHWLSDAN